MNTFIMTTAFGPTAQPDAGGYVELAKAVARKAKAVCPELEWKAHYAVMGPFDYLDVFEAPGVEAAMKVAAAIREKAPAEIRVWPAEAWKEYKDLVKDIA